MLLWNCVYILADNALFIEFAPHKFGKVRDKKCRLGAIINPSCNDKAISKNGDFFTVHNKSTIFTYVDAFPLKKRATFCDHFASILVSGMILKIAFLMTLHSGYLRVLCSAHVLNNSLPGATCAANIKPLNGTIGVKAHVIWMKPILEFIQNFQQLLQESNLVTVCFKRNKTIFSHFSNARDNIAKIRRFKPFPAISQKDTSRCCF